MGKSAFSKNMQKLRRNIVYFFAKYLSSILLLLPFKISANIAEYLALIVSVFLLKERRRILKNLDFAYSETLSPKQKKKILQDVFRHCGRSFVEFLWLRNPDKLFNILDIEVRGIENLKNALAMGKGILCLTAHFGNWELMGAYTSSRLGYPVNVLAREMHDSRINELLNSIRIAGGANVIDRKSELKGVFKCLKRNELLGILIDQDTKGDGLFVNFFDRPAFTQKGILILHNKTGSAIVPSFIYRVDKLKHIIEFCEQLKLPKNENLAVDIQEGLQICTNVVEDYVRKYPGQWMWMHRRWRRRQDNTMETY